MKDSGWRPIPGYEGIYEITPQGWMRNLASMVHFRGSLTPRGYLATNLVKDRVGKTALVHRLIWSAFVCPIPSWLTINHRNGKPADNRLSNLECVTIETNNWHSHRYLRRKKSKLPRKEGR